MNAIVSYLSRHLRPVLFLALLLAAAGLFAFAKIRRDIEPRLRTDYAVVTASVPGSSAQELAGTVTRRVEEELRRTAGVSDFDTRTADGFAVFTVRFDSRSGDPLEIRERLRNRLAELRAALASDIVGLTGPRLDDAAATPVDLVAGLAAPAGDLATLRAALPDLTRALKASPLVGDIDITGLPHDQAVVEYRDAELADAGLSPQVVTGLLKTQHFLAPGGYFDDGKTLAGVHTDARLKSVDELRAVGVLDPVTGRATTLDRLLDVKVRPRTPGAPAVTVAGQPGVRLGIARHPGVDAREFSAFVRSTLTACASRASLGEPVVLLDTAAFVRDDYRDFLNGLLAGGAILLAVLVAAMGARVGALVALTVPLVILCTLATLFAFGFTLNIVVLAALTIATGVVADNHIVVAQFVSRRLHRGEPRATALAGAFRALAGPLLAATLTAVAGFLPVFFADHLAGEYLRDILPVMAVALGFSYLFAFTLTPFLCAPSAAGTSLVAKLEHAYADALTGALRRPALVIVAALVLTLAGIAAFASRPSSFFPANDRALLAIEVLRTPGTAQGRVAADLAQIESRIAATLAETGITGSTRLAVAGGGLPRFSANMPPAFDLPHAGTVLLAFDSSASLARFREKFAAGPSLPGAITRVRPVAAGPQAAWPVRIELRGDADALAKAAPAALASLAKDTSLAHAHPESGDAILKWRVVPKRKETADKGVTPADIALALNSALNGLPAFELAADDGALPVVIRAKRTAEDPVSNLEDAYVYPAKGRPCLLSDVASVEKYTAPACVERVRGEPVFTLVADAAPGANPYDAEAAAVAKLAAELKDAGVTVRSAGLAKNAAEASRALLLAAPLALAAIFGALLVQTRSFRLNLVVLGVILFGVAGAGFGLAATGMPGGFMPLIGLTAMAGIAINIAIVLVASLADADPAESDPVAHLVRAASDRVEPILLSVLCAVGGMIPLYVFGGPLWHGMVVTLVSGLLLAALLLVFVLPVVFGLLKPTAPRS